MNVDPEIRRGIIKVEEMSLRDEDEKRLQQNACDMTAEGVHLKGVVAPARFSTEGMAKDRKSELEQG